MARANKAGQWLIDDMQVKKLANNALAKYSKDVSKPSLQGLRDYIYDARADMTFPMDKFSRMSGHGDPICMDMGVSASGQRTWKFRMKIDENGDLHSFPVDP